MRIRNKRVMLELLTGSVAFEKIAIAAKLEPDNLTRQILDAAKKRGALIEPAPRWKMPASRSGTVHEPIVGYLAPQRTWGLKELLSDLQSKGESPLFLLMNQVNLESNIGAIARSAFATGVNGLIFQGAKDAFFNEETLHVSLGAVARIPHVKANAHEAIKVLQDSGVKVMALQMNGATYYDQDLTGSVAFVLGAEREGVSENIASRCDVTLSIPMRAGIDSLNVAVSTSIVLYEKVRQEGGHFLEQRVP